MQRSTSSLVAGTILIALGVLALFVSLSGINLWTASWRWWPMVIIAFGALVALLKISSANAGWGCCSSSPRPSSPAVSCC